MSFSRRALLGFVAGLPLALKAGAVESALPQLPLCEDKIYAWWTADYGWIIKNCKVWHKSDAPHELFLEFLNREHLATCEDM